MFSFCRPWSENTISYPQHLHSIAPRQNINISLFDKALAHLEAQDGKQKMVRNWYEHFEHQQLQHTRKTRLCKRKCSAVNWVTIPDRSIVLRCQKRKRNARQGRNLTRNNIENHPSTSRKLPDIAFTCGHHGHGHAWPWSWCSWR